MFITMTVAEILQSIHVLVDGDVDYPSAGDTDYDTRLARVKEAVRIWESEGNVLWRDLVVSLSDAADGDTSTVADQEAYDAPSDFRYPMGKLRVVDSSGNSTYYTRIGAEDAQMYQNHADPRLYYVTGNEQDGYTIHILGAPESSGLTIAYDYYKSADIPTTGTETLEMVDPMFAVYWSAATEIEDEDPGKADIWRQVALNKLEAMKLKNDTPAPWEGSVINDDYSGFGD